MLSAKRWVDLRVLDHHEIFSLSPISHLTELAIRVVDQDETASRRIFLFDLDAQVDLFCIFTHLLSTV